MRNRRKIPKVVYLLLQQHHRTRGLAVVGWNKPPGNSYFSFYTLAANRPPPELNVAFDGLLTIYQDSVGMPAWSAGRQLEHPDWRNRDLSSAELVAWYRSHLDGALLFTTHTDALAIWRGRYTVRQSEAFLLTWNVLGLLAAQHGSEVLAAHELGGGRRRTIESTIGTASDIAPVQQVENFAFAFDGRVLCPSGAQVDLWRRYIAGQSATQLVDLLRRQGDSQDIVALSAYGPGIDPAVAATVAWLRGDGPRPGLCGDNIWRVEAMLNLARCVDGYDRHPLDERLDGEQWVAGMQARLEQEPDLSGVSTQNLLDLLFHLYRSDYWAGGGEIEHNPMAFRIATEIQWRIDYSLPEYRPVFTTPA
jgi:hypothetical protein